MGANCSTRYNSDHDKILVSDSIIYPWSLKVLDYPADKYHAQRDENRADCKTEDCP
ncbi:hypothetical protein AwEntero_25000 [Enterobacterales bacterium]|nr:hypothetical protein AwEntero_25000 [Enterobacterales bacterium]